MAHRVCPWWLGYFLLNPFRRIGQNPQKLLAAHVRNGMTVLEPGPGMGFFTLELLRMVGDKGRVIAIDIQPKMLAKLKQRATKAGLADRLDARLACADSMGITDLRGSVDFVLAFAVVHEFPDAACFFSEVAMSSKSGAALLLAEPSGHVKAAEFERELQAASQAGYMVASRPDISRSYAALLKKV
ncbi:MAG TPA: methyltransferase domain-containing protein [Terriglobales bacterium]|nr:methyltransferase domain-containing protein [Terriglobales bacterium]HXY14277.1 methyltransferase domain-containing protein [Terriglobales bacterium]